MKPRHLVLKPSYRLAYILALVSFLAGVLVIIMPFSCLLKLASITSLIFVTTYSIANNALLLLPWSCHALHLNNDDEIILTQRNGKELKVTALPTSLVMPQLTVLNLRAQGQLLSRSIVLLADSVDADDARLWRVWLKWGVRC